MARSLGFLLMTVSMTSNYFLRKQRENSTKNFLAVQLHVLPIAYSALYTESVYTYNWKKRCLLKSINHEQWDLMDLWVQLYYHCKFKVLLKNVYIYEAFRDDAFQKT